MAAAADTRDKDHANVGNLGQHSRIMDGAAVHPPTADAHLHGRRFKRGNDWSREMNDLGSGQLRAGKINGILPGHVPNDKALRIDITDINGKGHLPG